MLVDGGVAVTACLALVVLGLMAYCRVHVTASLPLVVVGLLVASVMAFYTSLALLIVGLLVDAGVAVKASLPLDLHGLELLEYFVHFLGGDGDSIIGDSDRLLGVGISRDLLMLRSLQLLGLG